MFPTISPATVLQTTATPSSSTLVSTIGFVTRDISTGHVRGMRKYKNTKPIRCCSCLYYFSSLFLCPHRTLIFFELSSFREFFFHAFIPPPRSLKIEFRSSVAHTYTPNYTRRVNCILFVSKPTRLRSDGGNVDDKHDTKITIITPVVPMTIYV